MNTHITLLGQKIRKSYGNFWGRGPRFESGISHNDPDALQDHCEIKVENLRIERETYPWGKKSSKIFFLASMIRIKFAKKHILSHPTVQR